jgi:hypothetical protein
MRVSVPSQFVCFLYPEASRCVFLACINLRLMQQCGFKLAEWPFLVTNLYQNHIKCPSKAVPLGCQKPFPPIYLETDVRERGKRGINMLAWRTHPDNPK